MAAHHLCTKHWKDWNLHVDTVSKLEKEQKKVTQVIYKLRIFFRERNKVFYSSLQKKLTLLLWLLSTFTGKTNKQKKILATIQLPLI